MNDVSNELDLLLPTLSPEVRSAAVLGSSSVVIAARLRQALPHATVHVIAETAREFDDADAGRHAAVVGEVHAGLDGDALTHTNRGSNGQLAMMKETFTSAEIAARGGGGYRVLTARGTEKVPTPAEAPVPTEELTVVVEEILGVQVRFRTNEAVFSKDRLDPGTRLLLETLPDELPGRVVDVGCGYGPMGIVLARRHPEIDVTMLDIDAQAVRRILPRKPTRTRPSRCP